MSDIEQNNTENMESPTQVVEEKKKVSRKRKVEYDENGNPVKKVRQTNKVKYPKVKVQPRTAYQFFIMEISKEASNNPDQPKRKTKELAELWQKTTDRTKFEEMAAADKQRFYEEVKANGYTIKEKKKKPTRPCSAFLLYAKDKQNEYREMHTCTYQEALKGLGERWNDPQFADERTPFIEEANRRKEQWKMEQEDNTEGDTSSTD
jgi:structure-specific recognition protein 1